MDSCHFHPSLLVSVQRLTSVVKDIVDLETLSFIMRVCEIIHTRVGTLIVATIYLQLIQNRYMF